MSLPPVPADGLSWGSNGPVLAAYQHRLKKLHFDPGNVDGVYGQDTEYAVVTVQKLLGLQTDGRIGPLVKLGARALQVHAGEAEAGAQSRRDQPRLPGAHRLQELAADPHHHDLHRQRRALLRRHRRLPVRDHADRPLPLLLPAQRLGHREARQDVEPVLLQRRDRGARARFGTAVPGVARLRAHPDGHRHVLPDARHQGRVGLRRRHAEASRATATSVPHAAPTTTTKPKPTTTVPKKHKPAKGTTSTTKPPAHTPTTPPTTPKTTTEDDAHHHAARRRRPTSHPHGVHGAKGWRRCLRSPGLRARRRARDRRERRYGRRASRARGRGAAR